MPPCHQGAPMHSEGIPLARRIKRVLELKVFYAFCASEKKVVKIKKA